MLNRQTDARQTVLDLSQQPAGLYLLNIQVGEHRTVQKISSSKRRVAVTKRAKQLAASPVFVTAYITL